LDKSRRDLLALSATAAAAALLRCGGDAASSRAPADDPATRPPAKPAALPPPIPAERYAQRRDKVAARMQEDKIDALLLTPSPSLLYLTGADLWRSERLIAFVLHRDGSCESLGPAFEAERLTGSGLPGTLTTWEESEDPQAKLVGILTRKTAAPTLSVEGTTWLDDLAPLSRRMPGARVASATPLISPFRMRKEPEEVDLIRAGARITVAVIGKLMEELKEGQTEEHTLARARALARESGVELDGLVQFGANSAVPHRAPGGAKLREGEVALFDLGVRVHGYSSDVTRTYAFGRPPERFSQVHETVRAAQEAGFRAARAGIPASATDEAARSIIRKAGFARYFTHRLGHGLGLQIHEPPYLVAGNPIALAEGMTVTVEPGIYLPGEFGVRLEDDVLVQATGSEVLSSDAPA
jgi:Xaa-Pro dipeptidase